MVDFPSTAKGTTLHPSERVKNSRPMAGKTGYNTALLMEDDFLTDLGDAWKRGP
jgi:hypothetical protein